MKPILFVYALKCLAFAQQPVTVIRGGMVTDGTGAAPRAATVVIRGERIEAVGPDLAAPAGARVVDAAGKKLVPRFFDPHTHLTASPVSGMSADWGKNAAAYLAAGITSINDFAEYSEDVRASARCWLRRYRDRMFIRGTAEHAGRARD